MKVLMINGSPRPNGNTAAALREMEQVFAAEGVETEVLSIGSQAIRGCIACRQCVERGKCVFDDAVNEVAPKFEACDGLVVGSPVYYASANATLIAFLTRLFYSTHFDKTMKVGAAVAAARRGGLTATYDELNKFFAISGMPIASGQYWNGVHGVQPGEAVQDIEGMQQMRTLARNMTFLMRCIADGREKYGVPKREAPTMMNFVR
ncbi:MAG: flavodoxin family protein [Oscillospiraceae bacterium]|nr:flavodoxin family protein [Oscillospiraceae bacterium]